MKLIAKMMSVMAVLAMSSALLSGQNLNGVKKKIQVFQDQSVDTYDGVKPVANPEYSGSNVNFATIDPSRALLYDNGPLITHPAGGFGGADASVLQSFSGPVLTSYGYGAQQNAGNTLADDFVVTGEWTIEKMTFYAYQTGSTTTSTITGLYFRFWNGAPNAGGIVVWGDLTTNRMTSTSWAGMYRSIETDFLASNRPIMEVVAQLYGCVLTPGTYWVEYQLTGFLSSGPWTPPVSIWDQGETGNSLQYTTAGGWASLVSGTTPNTYPQGLPFIIEGLLPAIPNNDLAVTSILAPNTGGPLTSTETVSIRVKNLGLNSQSNFPVSYTINGGAAVNETCTASIASGASYDFSFVTKANLSALGVYNFHACANLAGDQNAANNCIDKVVENIYPPYCSATTINQDEYISNVLCGTINNSSGWQGGVADYTAIFVTINSGQSREITITNGIPGNSDKVTVWVDWNKDFTFGAGTNEEFILTNVGGTGETFTGMVTVPAGQSIGMYRMRIRMTYTINPVPCGSAAYGEIEDYTVIVTNAPEIVVNPTSVTQYVQWGGTAQSTLAISNTGGQDMTFTIDVEFLNAAAVQPEGYNAAEAEAVLAARIAADGISAPAIALSHAKAGGVSPNQTDDEMIRYDDGVNYDAIGLTSGGKFQVAAYFPAATMGQYAGMSFQKLEFYINDVPDTCKIKIYGEGTSVTPGLLLYEQTVVPTGHFWNTFYLDPNVDITGEDLWIGFEITHQAGFYPAGLDAGPAITGFGDMISLDGSTWAPLSTYGYGLDYNWNIVGYLSESCCLSNDVGVQIFLSPVSGHNLGNEVVKIRVKNFGIASQSNIPVSYTLDGGAPVTGVVAGPLAGGATFDYTFAGTVNLGTVGQTYVFNACTALAGDEAPANNCKTANVTNVAPVYCGATTSVQDEYIVNVSMGTINNSSGWQGGVADYTAIYTEVTAGGSQAVTITNGTPWASDIVYIWVDWNKNYEFEGGQELTMLTNVNGTGATFTGSVAVPAGQGDGMYRMRIRMTYSTAPTPCGSATYGEVEDYTIRVFSLPTNDVAVQNIFSPVSGPNLGNEIVKIRVKNCGWAKQVNIPVFYSIDGGTAITGVVETPLQPGETCDYSFEGTANFGMPGHTYVINVCTALEGDEVSENDCKTVCITNLTSGYCDAATVNQYEFISKVNCGSINKISGWQSGIADYTAFSTTIPVGTSKPITVTNGCARAGEHVTAWVDWNKNNNFDSDSEQYVLTNVGGTGQTFTGTIAVPEGTSAGDHTMRIRMTFMESPTPCGYANYGEIEDYTINVFVQPPNDIGVISFLSPFMWLSPGKANVTIRVKNFGSTTQSEIPVSYILDGGAPVTGIIRGPLAPNETFDFTFPGFVCFENLGQNYSLFACTNLFGDEIPENDCKSQNVLVQMGYCICWTSVQDEYIANVLFGSINNSSGWQNGIADYRSLSTTIKAGESQMMTVTNGNAWALDRVTAWVDWNLDANFDYGYAYERYVLTNIGGTGEIFSGNIEVPACQPGGNYRMRIRMAYNHDPQSCGTHTYGETEDYMLIVEGATPPEIQVDTSPIVKILEPGQISSHELILANSGDAPLNFDLTVSTANETFKDGYQDNIISANDVGVLTILSPKTAENLGDQNVTIRVKNFGTNPQNYIPVSFIINNGTPITEYITAPLAGDSTLDFVFTNTVNMGSIGHVSHIEACTNLTNDENFLNNCKSSFVVNGLPMYCAANTTHNFEYISSTIFGSINNTSNWQDSIANFTDLYTTIEAGASENILVTNGSPYSNDRVYAWVDWNKDFDFNSTDEQYVLTDQNETGEAFTAEITVPLNQPSGDYRIRIRMCYWTEPVPCGGSTYGEIEEFTIKVVTNQSLTWFSADPIAGSINPNHSIAINVSFNPAGFTQGVYDGAIIITTNDPANPFTTIPLTLIVGTCLLPAPLNPEGFEIQPNIAHLSWLAPDVPGNLLGYNIYRNNQKINPDIVTNLFYEDSLANPSQYFYHITAVYPECEASSDTISLVITKINEKENDGITIFPNPATNLVNIKSQNSINQVSILSHLGQVVFSGDFESNSVQINTSGFNKGIYFLRIETEIGVINEKLAIR